MRTTRRLLLLLIATLTPSLAASGALEVDPSQRYRLIVLDAKNYELSPEDDEWTRSLSASLEERGGRVTSMWILPRAAAQIFLNDEETDSCDVYSDARSERRYVVYCTLSGFEVDFRNKTVASFDRDGASFHRPPSENFLVVVNQQGVPEDGFPVLREADVPSFSDQEVEWH